MEVIQLTRLDLCLYCRGTLRAGPRWVMQSMSGVPAAALCSVVHWFALSALAATPCLYPSVSQSREGPSLGPNRDLLLLLLLPTTTTTTTTLPTYLHTGYQSYCAALYAIRAGWPGRCCQNRVPCAGTLKLIRQPTPLVR